MVVQSDSQASGRFAFNLPVFEISIPTISVPILNMMCGAFIVYGAPRYER